MSTGLYVIELDFEVLRPIRSLPPFHGARWSALMRYATHEAGVDMEGTLLGLRPWHHGTCPMSEGEVLGLRVLLASDSLKSWPGLINVLHYSRCGEGEFHLGRSLRLYRARCGLTGQIVEDDLGALTPLNTAHVFPQARALSQADTWSMRFGAPLRLSRPGGGKEAGHRYCDQHYFESDPGASARLIEKIRHVETGTLITKPVPRIVKSNLKWQDMRYNAQRGIALGGATGELVMNGAPDEATALRLALGQYTGIGKNARFGLGYYTLQCPA